MTETNESISFALASAITQQLVDSGVQQLVASPGYRNSPLLLAAHCQEGLSVTSAVDERGAAFLALGMAKASSRPVAVACTSGTAVANYFPAVMEAFHSMVPLVVLTADRPWELVGTGANQCTDQTKVFGAHVRHFAEIPCPAPEQPGLEHGRYAVARALSRARSPVAGPVHLNIRFREPFLTQGSLPAPPARAPQAWAFLPAAAGPSGEQWEAVRAVLNAARRPLLVLGPAQLSASERELLAKISNHFAIPVCAEAASGLGCGEPAPQRLFLRADNALVAMAKGALPPPDLVIRVGEPLTGKGLGLLLKAFPQLPQLVLDRGGEAREPHLRPSILVEGGLEGWLRAIAGGDFVYEDASLTKALIQYNDQQEKEIDARLADAPLTEWRFHRELAAKLSHDFLLFLGNSMPIRDFNSVFPGTAKSGQILSNRGLSGIDGLLASAAGASLVSGRNAHAVLGDLSFLHDASSLSLLAANRERLRLTVWVMNNGGGEIFRIVPTAKAPGESAWFTTPQTYDAGALAKAFAIPYALVRSVADWQGLDFDGVNAPGVRLVEIQVNTPANLKVRLGS